MGNMLQRLGAGVLLNEDKSRASPTNQLNALWWDRIPRTVFEPLPTLSKHLQKILEEFIPSLLKL